MNKNIRNGLIALGVLGSSSAFAITADQVTTLSGGVDFTGIAGAMVAVAAAMLAPGAVRYAMRLITSWVR